MYFFLLHNTLTSMNSPTVGQIIDHDKCLRFFEMLEFSLVPPSRGKKKGERNLHLALSEQ